MDKDSKITVVAQLKELTVEDLEKVAGGGFTWTEVKFEAPDSGRSANRSFTTGIVTEGGDEA